MLLLRCLRELDQSCWSLVSEEAAMKKPLVHLHVDLHKVLTRVGEFGPWQLRTVILLMIASFIGGKYVINQALLCYQMIIPAQDCP